MENNERQTPPSTQCQSEVLGVRGGSFDALVTRGTEGVVLTTVHSLKALFLKALRHKKN